METKNIKLSFDAWQALRNLKFDSEEQTYSQLFYKIFEAINSGKINLDDLFESINRSIEENDRSRKSDKTFVIDDSIHQKLTNWKKEYMKKHNATARGPGAVSISQIVMTLVLQYRKNAH